MNAYNIIVNYFIKLISRRECWFEKIPLTTTKYFSNINILVNDYFSNFRTEEIAIQSSFKSNQSNKKMIAKKFVLSHRLI